MRTQPKPIYLLADSRLLFRSEGGGLLLDSVRREAGRDAPKAAYLGASNGDVPEYYSIFEAAMDGAGVHDRRMILGSFPEEDQSFLNEADIILLAGGDVERGWKAFAESGIRESVVKRYEEGAVLLGVSAGAVQLGLYGIAKAGAPGARLTSMFGLVPFVVDAHDEENRWGRLRSTLRLLGGGARGLGIPTGGGLVYHPESRRVEAVGRPLHELSTEGETIREALLPPARGGAE